MILSKVGELSLLFPIDFSIFIFNIGQYSGIIISDSSILKGKLSRLLLYFAAFQRK
jgi:hypothetical protein